ncbi:hypothetical protein CEXT_86201 [Caerostris extrusa]|uniref:Uncharacterized protein n=1 Tax=Caerostris extrusa TaxID=172846 RepID=A0AAV4WRX3_CAEEX|nr:hypothetical protein CEXT_86201 [Caerostris extrusa]
MLLDRSLIYSPIDPLLVLLLAFLSVDNENDCGFLFGGHPTQFLLLVSSRRRSHFVPQVHFQSVFYLSPSIDCKVAPDRKKEEEIEQNPRFIPSFHSPTLILTSPTPQPLIFHREFKRGRGKGGLLSVGWLGSGAMLFGRSLISLSHRSLAGVLAVFFCL